MQGTHAARGARGAKQCQPHGILMVHPRGVTASAEAETDGCQMVIGVPTCKQ